MAFENLSRRKLVARLCSATACSLLPDLKTYGLRPFKGADAAGDKCQPSARPTELQIAWQDKEVGMFVHFAPNVYYDQQGDAGGVSDPKLFNPYLLDPNQWVSVAESMGARSLILTAKHVGGFCLWPTATTDYSIASTPYENGKGDIVRAVSLACRDRRMGFGVYVSPRDDHHKVGLSGIVRSGDPEDQRKYDQVYETQLTELLTRYGPMTEVWFDGSARGELIGPIVRKYQPDAMIFNTSASTIRWIGNEDGVAPYPLWNTVTKEEHATGKSQGPGDPDGDVWLPAECDVTIRKDWFWSSTNASSLKSLDKLLDIYYKSVGRGANLLLNETPDRKGVIPAADVKRTAEFGNEVRRRFSTPIASTKGTGASLELPLNKEVWADHVVIQEKAAAGQRIRKYRVEAMTGGQWAVVAAGISIGHKRIQEFTRVRASKMRLVVEAAVCEPEIARFSAFYAGS